MWATAYLFALLPLGPNLLYWLAVVPPFFFFFSASPPSSSSFLCVWDVSPFHHLPGGAAKKKKKKKSGPGRLASASLRSSLRRWQHSTCCNRIRLDSFNFNRIAKFQLTNPMDGSGRTERDGWRAQLRR